jgi:acyl carrier protein
MVLPFDLKNLIELYPAAAGMPFLSEVGGGETHIARLYSRPKLRQQYVAPRNELERKLAELWRQTLHIENVGVHDSFFELGGDSVLAAQILALAQKTFGIRINPQDAFKAFTIEKLAEMLEAEMINKIEQMSEEEAAEKLLK